MLTCPGMDTLPCLSCFPIRGGGGTRLVCPRVVTTLPSFPRIDCHVRTSDDAKRERTMDRLIWVSWRAFWVGLGAATVLIAQTLSRAPAASAPEPPPTADMAPPHASSADRVLS